jgi:hypothetical protein
LKINITAVNDAKDILKELECHSYYFDTVRFANHINFSSKLQYGLMAQEVEAVVPNLVINSMLPPKVDSLGNILVASSPVKMINYVGFIPLIIEGYKEQSNTIDSLIDVIKQLQETVSTCCKAGSTGSTGFRSTSPQSIELSSANSIILNQNDPNPFQEQTKITFNIPEDYKTAKLMFYDNNGKILKEVLINERGSGELIVYASNLSNGIYSYSLIADGKLIDTKRMVCSK